MMKTNKVSNFLSRVNFNLDPKKPEIALWMGIGTGIASAVTLFIAARKMDPVVEKNKKRLEAAKEHARKEQMDEKESGKALIKAYGENLLDLGKLFLPSAALGAASVTCVLASHNMLSHRLEGVIAAYGSLNTAYKEYRRRVRDEYGEEADRKLSAIKKPEPVEATVQDESGKDVPAKVSVMQDPNQPSPFARFFDDGQDGWDPDPQYTLNFLRAQQATANDILHSRGYLFLREVYEMLGIKETKASQVVGWVYDPQNPAGDNYVDFGLYDSTDARMRDFVNGYEQAVLLDFNVDGVILDRVVDMRMMEGC